jgi:hypothetical protein
MKIFPVWSCAGLIVVGLPDIHYNSLCFAEGAKTDGVVLFMRSPAGRGLWVVASCWPLDEPASWMAASVARGLSDCNSAHWCARARDGCGSKSRVGSGSRIFSPDACAAGNLSSEERACTSAPMGGGRKRVIGSDQLSLGRIAGLGGKPAAARRRGSKRHSMTRASVVNFNEACLRRCARPDPLLIR